ncbi:hypothetical protein L9F63_004227, partial [Diploptera punctata]
HWCAVNEILAYREKIKIKLTIRNNINCVLGQYIIGQFRSVFIESSIFTHKPKWLFSDFSICDFTSTGGAQHPRLSRVICGEQYCQMKQCYPTVGTNPLVLNESTDVTNKRSIKSTAYSHGGGIATSRSLMIVGGINLGEGMAEVSSSSTS